MFPEDRMMEVLLIGALALIVIGPKDLPIAMRKLGQFIGKMRGMAAEFRASFDELARQSELDALRKEVEALRVSRESLTSAFNPLADTQLSSTVSEINQQLGARTVMTPLGAFSVAAPEPEGLTVPEIPAPSANAAPPPAAGVEPTPAMAPAEPIPTVAAPRPKAARKAADQAQLNPVRPKAANRSDDKVVSRTP